MIKAILKLSLATIILTSANAFADDNLIASSDKTIASVNVNCAEAGFCKDVFAANIQTLGGASKKQALKQITSDTAK